MLSDSKTELLLAQARDGNSQATQELLDQHRSRLKRMVAVRMDDRLVRRIDPSDVVQETLITALRALDDYLREPTVGFYPWLRQIAWERLIDLHRRHLHAERRSLLRETMSDRSSCDLALMLTRSEDGPLTRAAWHELQERTRAALDKLAAADREVLVLRLLEQNSVKETAQILGCSPGAVKTRQVRALQRLRRELAGLDEEFKG